jgi:tripartite-type tricarboxylate transporter receptor subunit TctC
VRTDIGIDNFQTFVNNTKSDLIVIISSDDGPGNSAKISSLLIQETIGTTFATIPYQRYAPAVAASASGESNTTTVTKAQMIDPSNSGDVRILAVAGGYASLSRKPLPKRDFPSSFRNSSACSHPKACYSVAKRGLKKLC